MRKFKISLAVMVVLGTMFGTGCNDMNNVFHERSGVMVSGVDPMTLKPAFTGTDEAQLVVTATFPTATVSFTNLNAIPATIRSVKIDYFDIATGQKVNALTAAIQTFIPVPGVTVSAGATTTTTSATTPASTSGGSSSVTPSGESAGLTINPWNESVKTAMYGNLTTREDNRPLEARVDMFGEDSNGNTFALNAAFTLIP